MRQRQREVEVMKLMPNWDEVWTHVSAVGPALRRAYSLFIGEAFSIMGLLWLFAHSYDMSLLGV